MEEIENKRIKYTRQKWQINNKPLKGKRKGICNEYFKW